MSQDLASRLRALRARHNWTVVDMSERTGIPKRTLDKYMLRSGAVLPGFEALMALSKGLGVSLDWLVFGAEFVSESSELIAAKAASEVIEEFCEVLLRSHQSGDEPVFVGETILNLTPEFWAGDLGWRVGDAAKKLAAGGVSLHELMEWKEGYSERQRELLHDLFDRQMNFKQKPKCT